MPKSYKNTRLGAIRHLLSLARHYRRSRRADISFAGEYRHIASLLSRLSIERGFAVDIAASDGVGQSCTLPLFRDRGWAGLAVEMDPGKFSKLAFLYAPFPNVKLARGRVTPSNVASMLRGFEVPHDFDLLNLDIDSYDLYVMAEMLKSGFRPKVITMEINENIPPPIYFTVEYDEHHYWRGDLYFGCSLAAASTLIKPYGYILESLQYNNAMFIRSDFASNVFNDASDDQAYDAGYRNRADRKVLFRQNADVECLLNFSAQESIAFLKTLFKKYEGKYTLR